MHYTKELLGLVIGVLIITGIFLFIERPIQHSFDEATITRITTSRQLASDWLTSNLEEKGIFTYRFDPATGYIPNTNNALRQLMASIVLAKEAHTDESVRKLHQKNLTFIMQNWLQIGPDNTGYILYDEKSKLGANAMFLRTLVHSPFFEENRETAQAMVNGILLLQQPDGSLLPWLVTPRYNYDADYLLKFYSGEAILALLEYYEKTNDKAVLDAALVSTQFYTEKYIVQLEENYYPAYAPWYILVYHKLFAITGDETYAAHAFTLADKLLELQDTRLTIGRFYNRLTPQYGNPHVSSDGVYLEGIVYAYDLARQLKDRARANTYEDAIRLSANYIMSLQYTEPDLVQLQGDPSWYVGAFRIHDSSTVTRVDNQQHVYDAFTKLLEVLEH